MKIKDVASLARDAGGVTLVSEMDGSVTARQWLVVGGTAVYPLDGLPTLHKETLMAVLDVPMKKRDSYRVHETELTETFQKFTADTGCDRPAEMSGLEIGWDGMRIRCAYADDGSTVFVNTRWLKPLDGAKKDTSFWIREDENGQKMLVVKKGVLNILCVGSSDVWIDDKEARELQRMAKHAWRASEENRERKANAER